MKEQGIIILVNALIHACMYSTNLCEYVLYGTYLEEIRNDKANQ